MSLAEQTKAVCFACVNIPHVAYKDRSEFVSLAYQAKDAYISLLQKSLEFELQRNARLNSWNSRYSALPHVGPDSARFMPIFDSTSFELLQKHGSLAISILTKQCGIDWCHKIALFMHAQLVRVAQVYTNTIMYSEFYDAGDTQWPLGKSGNLAQFKQGQCLDILQEEVHNLFAGSVPLCVATSNGFLSQLMAHNFYTIIIDMPDTFYWDARRRMHLPEIRHVSHMEFEHMMLVVCMASVDRLGSRSCLSVLDKDILQLVCSFVRHTPKSLDFFASEEQWLF